MAVVSFFLKMKSLLIDLKKWKNIHFWKRFRDINEEFQVYSICHLFYEYDGTCRLRFSTIFCGFTQEPFWGIALGFASDGSRLLYFSSTFCSLFAIFPDYLVVYCLCCLQHFCIYNIERGCKLLGQPDNQTCHISNLSVCVKFNL